MTISDRPEKKYLILYRGHKISIGERGADDYTIHKDDERKARYINRHRLRERWNDPSTAGFWARWLLWNKPTLRESIKDIQERFGLQYVR
jgi:hypothetical protein